MYCPAAEGIGAHLKHSGARDVITKLLGVLRSTPSDVRPQTKIRRHTPRRDKSSIFEREEYLTTDIYTSKKSATARGRYLRPPSLDDGDSMLEESSK